MVNLRYRPDVDGLRAVGILAVIVYHYGVPGFSGGFVGVDVFFVISGFLITSLIDREIGEHRFTLMHFYERRIRRIFPALTVVLFVIAVIAYFEFFPAVFKRFAESLGATSAFLSNVEFWREAGYFATIADQKPLLHTWSLAVEEQFYLFFPPLMILLARYSRRWMATVFLVIFAASLGLSVWTASAAPQAGFYLFPSRMWELLVGALIAVGAFPLVSHRLTNNAFAASGLAMIVCAVVLYTRDMPFPGAAALLPCLGAGLVIYAGAAGNPAINRILSTRPMVFVGLISYSLYLWHWPLYVFGKYHFQRELMPLETIGLIAASFAIAMLSWRYVEQPFRRPGGVGPRRLIFLQAAAVTSISAVYGAAIYMTNGVPQRFAPDIQALLAPETQTQSTACGTAGSEQTPVGLMCKLGRPGRSVSFLVWGDSHARALGPAVDHAADRLGALGLFAPLEGCPPLLGMRWRDLGSDRCRRHNDLIRAFLQEREIDTVILIAHWTWYAEGSQFGKENRAPVYFHDDESRDLSTAENREVFARSLRRTINDLRGKVRRIIIVGPVPEVASEVPTTLAWRRIRGLSEDIGATPSEFEARNASVMRNFAGFGTSAAFVYPHRILCAEPRCTVARDGKPLYFDEEHLSRFGAESVSEVFDPIFQSGH